MAASKKPLGKSNTHLTVNGRIWIESDGTKFFGPGPLELLELIQNTGSINKAAGIMQMSYKKAWEIVSNLNEHSSLPLVITKTGGQKGGGSSISPAAEKLIKEYRLLEQKFRQFLERQTTSFQK